MFCCWTVLSFSRNPAKLSSSERVLFFFFFSLVPPLSCSTSFLPYRRNTPIWEGEREKKKKMVANRRKNFQRPPLPSFAYLGILCSSKNFTPPLNPRVKKTRSMYTLDVETEVLICQRWLGGKLELRIVYPRFGTDGARREFGRRETVVNLAYAPVGTNPRSLANVLAAWVRNKEPWFE